MQAQRKAQLLVVTGLLLCMPLPGGLRCTAAAQGMYSWDGGSVTSNALSNPLNWTNNVLPPNDGSAQWGFPDSPRTTPVAIQTWDVSGIVFSSTGTAYALSGSDLSMGANGIMSVSPVLQTVNNNVTLTAAQTWNAAQGPLELTGTISLGAHVLTLAGSHDIALDGAIGSGVLEMQATGRLTLAGLSSLTDLNVLAGELRIDTGQPVSPGQLLEFANGTEFSSGGSYSCPMGIAVSGRVTYSGSGTLAVLGVYGGTTDTLTVDGAGTLEVLGGALSGHLLVESGTFVSNRITPAPLSTVVVGTGFGTPVSATLQTLDEQQFMPTTSVQVLADGHLDLQGGRQSLAALTLNGGLVTGVGLETDTLTTQASSRMASLQCLWTATGNAQAHVADGTSEPDLQVAGDVLAQAGIDKYGAGSVRFTARTLGSGPLYVHEGHAILATQDSIAALDTVEVAASAALTLETAYQLGDDCQLNLGPDATVTLLADARAGNLSSQGDGANIYFSSARLELTNSEHTFSGTTSRTLINGPVEFLWAHSKVTLLDSAVVDVRDSLVASHELTFQGPSSAQARVTMISAHTVVLDGPELHVAEIAAHLDQRAGTLNPRSFASFTGNLTVNGDWTQTGGDLNIDVSGGLNGVTYDQVTVLGRAEIGGTLTLANSVPLANGTVLTIVTADSIAGTFSTVLAPFIGEDQAVAVYFFDDHIEVRILATTTSVPEETPEGGTGSPRRVVLHQNRPNPFNPRTTIAFELPQATNVSLRILDAAGRRVRSFASRHVEAGRVEVVWDGRDDASRTVSSGVYFYRLIAGPFHETRRMVLIR